MNNKENATSPNKEMDDSISYEMTPQVTKSYQDLRNTLAGYKHVAVAFSGGVDSTLLLHVAHDVLGNRVIAFTASSCSFPQRELNEAVSFCRQKGIEQVVFNAEELDVEGFSDNPLNRCYLCKQALFEKMIALACERGIETIIDGTNLDDKQDYRPGNQAKIEAGVISPLAETCFNKKAIRVLSKDLGLPTYNKQSFACLASRIPYGEPITEEILNKIDKAEQFLLDQGFIQVRVRVHGSIARIEISPYQFSLLFQDDTHERVVRHLQSLGFLYVTLDLTGYRTGSMNIALPTEA